MSCLLCIIEIVGYFVNAFPVIHSLRFMLIACTSCYNAHASCNYVWNSLHEQLITDFSPM